MWIRRRSVESDEGAAVVRCWNLALDDLAGLEVDEDLKRNCAILLDARRGAAETTLLRER